MARGGRQKRNSRSASFDILSSDDQGVFDSQISSEIEKLYTIVDSGFDRVDGSEEFQSREMAGLNLMEFKLGNGDYSPSMCLEDLSILKATVSTMRMGLALSMGVDLRPLGLKRGPIMRKRKVKGNEAYREISFAVEQTFHDAVDGLGYQGDRLLDLKSGAVYTIDRFLTDLDAIGSAVKYIRSRYDSIKSSGKPKQ
jgi:hypothetical protein